MPQLADIFKASASAARKSIAKDCAIRLQSMCDDAQRAHDKGDVRTFFSVKRALCPKPKSSPIFVMDGSDVCVYWKDIRCAFQKFVCGLPHGRIVTLEEALEEIITCILACDSFDIAILPKQTMYDIVKASRQWNAPGRDALMYGVFACSLKFLIYILICFSSSVVTDLLLSGAHPFCKNCKKKKRPHFTFEGLP